MTMAVQPTDKLSVQQILELNVDELKKMLNQQGFPIKGLTKSQLQSHLINLNLASDREELDEMCSN